MPKEIHKMEVCFANTKPVIKGIWNCYSAVIRYPNSLYFSTVPTLVHDSEIQVPLVAQNS